MTVPVFRVIRMRFIEHQNDETFLDDVDDDHVTILEHIKAGDGDGAARAMAEHLTRLRSIYAAGEARA